MKLLVYTAQPTPRVEYACRVLFKCILGLPVALTADWAAFLADSSPRLIYGRSPEASAIPRLPASPLLRETGVHPLSPKVETIRQLPAAFLCPAGTGTLLPFDLLSFTFFMASRYEEYLPFEADAHGRFPAKESLAYRYGFLQRPILQEWGLRLLDKLQQHYPNLPDARPAYQFRPTYDIDMAWAFRHRPLWLQGGGVLRDILRGKPKLVQARFHVLFGGAEDPFYTFNYLAALHGIYDLKPLYFLLLGDHGPYDKNLPPERKPMQALVAQLSEYADTGLHPSYRSNEKPEVLPLEAQRFERLTGQAPVRSRQHFLKLSFPNTYRRLIRAGIREDYTMGYAGAIGFRAGLSVPYPWYDLEAESEQPLSIYPFALMDVTLRQYLQLAPEAAIEVIQALVDKVRSTGGVFLPLWHNSSFAETHGWKGWDRVHEVLLQYGSSKS